MVNNASKELAAMNEVCNAKAGVTYSGGKLVPVEHQLKSDGKGRYYLYRGVLNNGFHVICEEVQEFTNINEAVSEFGYLIENVRYEVH